MVPLKIGHFYIKKLHEKWCPPFLSFSRIGCLRVNAINFLIYGGINTDIMRKTLFWVEWYFDRSKMGISGGKSQKVGLKYSDNGGISI